MQIRSRYLHSADQSQVVLDIITKLYALDVILEYSVLDVVTKLYTLDVILYYSSSEARIREEITSTEDTTSKTVRLRPPTYCDPPSNICKYNTVCLNGSGTLILSCFTALVQDLL